MSELTDQARKFLVDVFRSVNTIEKLKELSNEEIGALLFFCIWADIPIFSPKSYLIEEAIRRLGYEMPDEPDDAEIGGDGEVE